jgi:prepilin-type N-terminal cleavage/methylation domain-containing protein
MNAMVPTRSEAGMTLAEVLVAVAILGIAIASIVAGLGSASMASDRHRKQVNGDAVVRSYAEVIEQRVHSSSTNYVSPPTISSYPPGSWTPATGYTVGITSVQCLYQSDLATFVDCTTATNDVAQLLKLSASSSDGRDTESLEMVVRRS